MSKCSDCAGTGKVTCPTCHGEGFFAKVSAETGETVRRLCALCGGDRQIRCGACRGTGEIAPVHTPAGGAPAAKPKPVSQPDRLAGRWSGQQATWYEFVADGPRYKVTAGGPRGVSGTGTATINGHKVAVDATDVLCGHYQLELSLQGDHMEGIDRKAGFPIPVRFERVAVKPK